MKDPKKSSIYAEKVRAEGSCSAQKGQPRGFFPEAALFLFLFRFFFRFFYFFSRLRLLLSAHLLFLLPDHLFDHLSANGTCLGRSQISVISLF